MSSVGNGTGKRFWTAKEAANYVGVATRTLYGYCRTKKRRKLHIAVPPFRRIGCRLRFPITEFIEWANRFDSPAQER